MDLERLLIWDFLNLKRVDKKRKPAARDSDSEEEASKSEEASEEEYVSVFEKN